MIPCGDGGVLLLKKGGRTTSYIMKPTHFLALPLSSPALHERTREIQHKIVTGSMNENDEKRHFRLERCCARSPPEKLHITLFVMTLIDEIEVNAAVNLLHSENMSELLRKLYPEARPRLKFSGLDSFGSRVAFVPVEEAEQQRGCLQQLQQSLRSEFMAAGLLGMNGGGNQRKMQSAHWVPHVTIMKKPPNQRETVLKGCWEDYRDFDLGCESISTLQLCSMDGEGRCGYYR